ncbi:MAG TPA: FHA domain-containing protein [Planctomycetota bacterium]|nr:FHA domain-containing protein [Planctomycetota bacterium]
MSEAKLIGTMDPVKGTVISCTGMVKIGRDEKLNSCAVKHASVSRQHAQLFQENGQWFVEDLKSTNGVFVNEAKINVKAPISSGDVVRIGDIPFKFEQSNEFVATQVLAKGPPAAAPAPAAAAPVAAAAAAAPAARPPVPPPVARPAAPAPRPVAKTEQDGGGGEDLFEPSIVGGADMGAAIRAAQAGGSKAPAAPPPQEGEFEGTMYGPQVARQLVQAIREEKEHHQEASSGKGDKGTGAKPRVAGPQTPNMFLLKIKAAAFMIIFIGGLVGGVVYLLSGRAETEKAQEIYKSVKVPFEEFVDANESKVIEGLEMAKTLETELSKLEQIRADIQKAGKQLEKQKEYLAKINELDEKARFLVFERKLKQAIIKKDKGAAEQLIEDMKNNGKVQQKEIMPLATLIMKFQLFRQNFPDEPKRAETAPPKELIDELTGHQLELEKEYKERSTYLQVEGKRFYGMAKEVIESDLAAMLAWNKYWTEVKEYEASKDAAKLDSLKKSYPNNKAIQALK